MIADMKTMLHYAEDVVQGDDSKLSELGAGEAGLNRTRWKFLASQGCWKHCGRAQAGWCSIGKSLRTVARQLPTGSSGGAWTLAGMAMDTEITLNEQPHGKEWEYRVIAVNKAGEGEPSNTVTAVL